VVKKTTLPLKWITNEYIYLQMKPGMVSEMERWPNETKGTINKIANDPTPTANDCKWNQTESKAE